MKLTDLDPRWLYRDGQRIGFIFKSPTNQNWYQSCFLISPTHREQHAAFSEALPEYGEWAYTKVQGCKEGCCWSIDGGIENASFETLTVLPSLDGSAGGLWHGYIKLGSTE